ncbi:MAG TPA: hypothetical protein VIJ63_21285 [Roseiarcus sp.]
MISQPLSEEVDGCGYLYFRRLWEPRDNHLCVVIDEAMITDEAPADMADVPPKLVTQIRPIVVAPQSRAFQLVWERCVAYSVTSESFHVRGEADRIASGRLLVVYEQSDYLNYLRRVTWDTGNVFGPIVHVGIFCLNHIIDVVSFGPPDVQPTLPLPSE